MLTHLIEFLFSFGLFINALLFIPQILKLYKTKNPEGLSLITFGGFSIIQTLAVLHGIIHQDFILTLGFSLSLFTCGTVTVLLIWYKFKLLK